MKNSEIAKLFLRIKNFGLFTNSKTHDKVYSQNQKKAQIARSANEHGAEIGIKITITKLDNFAAGCVAV